MDAYGDIYAALTEQSGSGFWDFRTLKLSGFWDFGQQLAEILVDDGVLDSVDDSLKHFVPTPQFRNTIIRG